MSLSPHHEVYRLYVTHHSGGKKAEHGYTAIFLFGRYVQWVAIKPAELAAHLFAVHMRQMVKKLAVENAVEDGWEPFPANSMVYERSAQISRVMEEQPQQQVCEILADLDLVKYGWQN